MLAACYPTSGPSAGKLEVRDLPEPSPGAGEVLVRVAVSGVNPTDWKARGPGALTAAPGALVTPNQDGAGTIEAVGPGVDPERIGQRVWLYNAAWQRVGGTAAQWAALPAEQAVALPDGASFDLGASLGIPAMTAHRCLFAGGELEPGTPVLVHGGAGAVGHAAIELAAWRGLRIATTVSSPEKAALARDAGAQLVADYRTEDVVEAVRAWAPDGVARVIDVDLAGNLALNARLLAAGGAISGYAGAGAATELPRGLMFLNAAVEFVLVYTIPEPAKAAAVADITRALQDGAMTPLPLHRFALSDIAAAHDAVRDGIVGKVLVDIP